MKQSVVNCLVKAHRIATRQRYVRKLQIEVTGNCNLNCAYCFRSTNEYAAKGHDMEFDLYRKIIDEAKPYWVYPGKSLKPNLLLHGFGEPTLHPQLADMIRYASDSGKFSGVRVITNLTVLAPNDYDALFDAGLTKLGISIDTLEEDHLAQTRRGSNLQRLVSALKHLCCTQPDKLQILTVLSESNYDHFASLRQELQSMGLPSLEVQRLITYTNDFGITDEQWREFRRRYEQDDFVQLSQPPVSQKPSCTRPLDYLYIDAHGFMLPCCIIPMSEKLHFGNVQDDGVYKRYSCPDFEKFRSEFLASRPTHCEGCAFYDEGHSCNDI